MHAKKLSPTDLMKGAYYAIEQAGLLLHDAFALYKEGRYSSAVVLAVFSYEELGRAVIYWNQRKRILPSGSMSAKSLKRSCKEHTEKLRRGQMSVTFMMPPQLRVNPWKLMDMKFEISDRIRKHRPREYHSRRKQSLYVEPNNLGGWNRPCTFSPEHCKRLLQDVANNYGFYIGQVLFGDAERKAAMEKWRGRPTLPKRPLDP